MDLKTLKIEAEKALNMVRDLGTLEVLERKYLGKKSELNQILGSLQKIPKAKRAKIGQEANHLKRLLAEEFKKRKLALASGDSGGIEEWLDVTTPGKKPFLGHLHPLTLAQRKVMEIFGNMGFTMVEGPEIETPWYNFDALNIPRDHPARDLWDTFWLKSESPKLLRTHTSPVQVRYLEKHHPPLRIIAPGNVYRHEATDVSHEFQLYQVEGLMVGKDISVANFKAIVAEFFRRFFGKNIGFRLRPDYFPFTEPSFDISITCVVCGGKGCTLCKGTGWVEVAGAGMVHPNVFKNAGLVAHPSADGWQGWAFGFGLERLVMMKYKINDIRLFRSGDFRFLNQF